MGFLLYDLYFDIAWLFSPHNHKIVYLVMAVVHVHIVFAVISISFPGLSNLPCALCIPSKPPSFLETQIPHSFELQSKTLHVVKMLVSSVLSFFIIHFKVRVIQNFNLPNFLVSLLALTTIIFYTDVSVLQESIVHGFFKANDQVWINFKLFVRNSSTPCCYYLEIISIFA